MILCRFNAPLVSQYFQLIRMKKYAVILGRDIGNSLRKLIEKLDTDGTVVSLIGNLSDWYQSETAKEVAKRIPSESKLTNIQDRYECIMFFTEEVSSVAAMLQRFDEIFVQEADSEAIRLSSIHKAKGLEAETVYILEPDTLPRIRSKKAWQEQQEKNLKYVAITRAILNVCYVRS